MGSHPATDYCYQNIWPLVYQYYSSTGSYVNLTNLDVNSLRSFCLDIIACESNSEIEVSYSAPMLLIGIYISIASLFCILAMALDLFYGFRNRKFWFPTKYFSLNAASITVITVAMKLPVDLSSPMQGDVDQVAKSGGLAFMCTMMSNFMPSLASMDDNSLLANVIGLSILVITLIANISIQIRTRVIDPFSLDEYVFSPVVAACIYVGMLIFLLVILISAAITIPTSKKILESKYQAATSKFTTLNDPQENQISAVEKLRQLVKRYWIMTETGSPQFVIASNPLSCASGIICAISTLTYIYMVYQGHMGYEFVSCYNYKNGRYNYGSVYKWSMKFIFITQSIGIVVGSIAPIFRCFILLSFKSFPNQNRKLYFLVFKVEKYWTQKLCEWKESGISFLSSGRRSRTLLYNLKSRFLSFCIGFQKVIVVSCKITGLIPTVVIIFAIYCSYHLKSLKEMLFTPRSPPPTDSSSVGNDTNEGLSSYVLLLEDNMSLAEKKMKGISDAMNRLIQLAEKKHHKNLLMLLENSVAFDGVETFDTDQIQSLLSHVEPAVNSWSLPIVTLTCIAIVLPNIRKDRVENLLKSVGEGLLYTHLVEENLNKASEYVNIHRATAKVWHEVEDKCKWLGTTLERSAYDGKTTTEIVKSFAHIAEEILSKFNTSTNGKVVEKESIPLKVIAANSMYRIAKTIMHRYESNKLDITEDRLFSGLSSMIADIFSACLTNIPQVVTMRCHESVIEKREASVLAAIDLLGRTMKIIKRLETRVPSMDQYQMAFIDEWRLHLRQP